MPIQLVDTPHTQIWNVTEEARAMAPVHDDASLSVWLTHAPWMHPLWCWHYVSLIHLRDIPNQSKPPFHRFAGSTHELLVFAIDPNHPPDLKHLEPIHPLSPASIVQQFQAEHDAAALALVEGCLKLRVSLDSDARAVWRHLLTECGRAQQ